MIVGVDLSTHRIDLAWISPRDGTPQRWHQELGSRKVDTIDRLRAIEIHWPRYGTPPDDTTEVVIEWPYGRSSNLLMAVVGVITNQAPTWARVSWLKSHDLRAAIGAKNSKPSAETMILTHARGMAWDLEGWNEHELDALVTCLGGTHILEHPTNTKEPHS